MPTWATKFMIQAGHSMWVVPPDRHLGYHVILDISHVLLWYSFASCLCIHIMYAQHWLCNFRCHHRFAWRNLYKDVFFCHSCNLWHNNMWRVQQHLPERMARCLPISKKLILKQLDKPFKRATERCQVCRWFCRRFGGFAWGPGEPVKNGEEGKTSLNLCFQLSIGSIITAWNQNFTICSESRSIQPISLFDIAFMNSWIEEYTHRILVGNIYIHTFTINLGKM